MQSNLRVDFMSAVQASSYACTEPHAFISIRDLDGQRVNLPVNERRVGEVYLEFDDLDHTPASRPETRLFSRRDALTVVKLVLEHPEVNLVLVNCMAGVSRSCAVAVGLDQLFNGGRGYLDLVSHGVPNNHIVRTIVDLAEPYVNAEAYDGPVPSCVDHCDRGCCFACADVRTCALTGKTCGVLRTRYATPVDCNRAACERTCS